MQRCRAARANAPRLRARARRRSMGPDLSDSGGRLGFPLLCQLLNRYVGYREIFPRLRRRAGTYLPMIGVGGGKKHGPSGREVVGRGAQTRLATIQRLVCTHAPEPHMHRFAFRFTLRVHPPDSSSVCRTTDMHMVLCMDTLRHNHGFFLLEPRVYRRASGAWKDACLRWGNCLPAARHIAARSTAESHRSQSRTWQPTRAPFT